MISTWIIAEIKKKEELDRLRKESENSIHIEAPNLDETFPEVKEDENQQKTIVIDML